MCRWITALGPLRTGSCRDAEKFPLRPSRRAPPTFGDISSSHSTIVPSHRHPKTASRSYSWGEPAAAPPRSAHSIDHSDNSTELSDAPAMPQLRLRAPQPALRSLAARPLRVQRPASTVRCYATDLEPERPKQPAKASQGKESQVGRSFQGQMMGSISSRLRREQEQRVQYEKWRDITDPSRNWMITFGTWTEGERCDAADGADSFVQFS